MSEASARYVVLGSGSKLHKSVESFACGRLSRVFRTADLFAGRFRAGVGEVTLVYSMLDRSSLAILFREVLGPVVVVGSCAALSPVWGRFAYSRRKRSQLETVLSESDARIKYIVFGDFFPNNRLGLSFFTDRSEFWHICDYAVRTPEQVLLAYQVAGSEDLGSRLLTRADMLFAPAATVFIKKFTKYSYGYNNAAIASTKGLNAAAYSFG